MVKKKPPASPISQQLAAQARAQVAAILGPQTSVLNTAYRNQGAGLNAAYGAVAEMQKGVAPAIQQTYDAASARQAVLGKGFADGFKMASEGAAGGLNQILADQGSQQTVTPAGEAGANVLYGLGGALPANTLNQQGAAFASAAEYLPGQAKQLGLDSLKASEQARVQAIRELEGKRPELVNAALQQILEGKRADKALAINKWYLKNALRKTGAAITGVDPVTGLPTAAVTAATTKAAAVKATAREKAVAKRSDATVQSLGDTSDWIEKQLDADSLKVVGYEPLEGPTDKTDPDIPMPQWYTKGGGLTTNINDPDILKKPVYSPTAISKPDYNALFGKVLSRLRRELGRYGYKTKVLRGMAKELLGDYYEVTEMTPAPPNAVPKW